MTSDEVRAATIGLLVDELRKRVHGVKVVDGDLKVDGTTVPVEVREESSGYYTRGLRGGTGRFRLNINRLWNQVTYRTVLATKQFMQAKARADTQGFDIAKIADYVEKWLTTAATEARYADKHKRWVAVTDRLKKAYPGVGLSATSYGVKVTAVVDEEMAVRLLTILSETK